MKRPFPPKNCKECGVTYPMNKKYTWKQAKKSEFCSVPCRNLHKRKVNAALGRTDARTRRKYAPRPQPINCEACGKDTIGIYRGMVLDHNHKTNEFRGWLCSRCNVALGMLDDDPNKLVGLIRYLEKNESNLS